jgi:hypothetical protein
LPGLVVRQTLLQRRKIPGEARGPTDGFLLKGDRIGEVSRIGRCRGPYLERRRVVFHMGEHLVDQCVRT